MTVLVIGAGLWYLFSMPPKRSDPSFPLVMYVCYPRDHLAEGKYEVSGSGVDGTPAYRSTRLGSNYTLYKNKEDEDEDILWYLTDVLSPTRYKHKYKAAVPGQTPMGLEYRHILVNQPIPLSVQETPCSNMGGSFWHMWENRSTITFQNLGAPPGMGIYWIGNSKGAFAQGGVEERRDFLEHGVMAGQRATFGDQFVIRGNDLMRPFRVSIQLERGLSDEYPYKLTFHAIAMEQVHGPLQLVHRAGKKHQVQTMQIDRGESIAFYTHLHNPFKILDKDGKEVVGINLVADGISPEMIWTCMIIFVAKLSLGCAMYSRDKKAAKQRRLDKLWRED
jgi:hypothetical protein